MASSTSRNPLPVGKIRNLTPTTRPRPLEVIVTRIWDVQVLNADTFNFIVMDADGDQIHGWVQCRLAADYEPHVYENSILRLENFNLTEQRNKYYSPLKNQYNIIFTERTKVEPIFENIRFPPQPFKFTDFEDLQPLVGKKSFLSDVIGMFEYLGEPKQVAATKRLRELFIHNERDEALKITFWNEDIGLIP